MVNKLKFEKYFFVEIDLPIFTTQYQGNKLRRNFLGLKFKFQGLLNFKNSNKGEFYERRLLD